MKGKKAMCAIISSLLAVNMLGTTIMGAELEPNSAEASYSNVLQDTPQENTEENVNTYEFEYDKEVEGVFFKDSKAVAIRDSVLDANLDGQIGISDVVIVARICAEDTTLEYGKYKFVDANCDYNYRFDDLTWILRYLAGFKVNPVVVKGLPVEPDEGTTTTTSTTTTTTETTTTTTTTPTTTTTTETTTTTATPTTTTTTQTETTTTTTETTTSTTTETTTTTTTMTTTTNTTTTTETTTTTTEDSNAPFKLIDEVIDSITIADTNVPAYKGDDSHYEISDQVYLFKANGKTYAYTLIANNPTDIGGYLLYNHTEIAGIHIWLYEGSEKAVSVKDALPDTTGMTIPVPESKRQSYNNKTEISYRLEKYEELNFSELGEIARDLTDRYRMYEEPSEIARFDYNLNGVVDREDLAIAIRYSTSNPYTLFCDLNQEVFERYIDVFAMPEYNHTNVALLRASKSGVVEYAFNIPTSDFVPDCVGDCWLTPIQILPKEMLEEVSAVCEFDEDVSDAGCEYIAWEPYLDAYATIDRTKDTGWYFQAGVYAYLINADGTYKLEWARNT